jgi:preprotein translocase subunit SecF
MTIFNQDRTYNVLKFSKLFILMSLTFVAISWGLTAIKGMTFGIDFAGGTVVQVKYAKAAPLKEIRDVLANSKFNKASIQEFGSLEEIIIKIPTASHDLNQDIGDDIRGILQNTPAHEIRRVDIVGPKVGNELRVKGVYALAVALIGILLYVSFRFEWRFALAAIFALVHDISLVIGVIVLVKVDVNLDILAGLLTILGYSLNDTIVVFDRIRESLMKSKEVNLNDVINEAISRTLSRTTLTSLTTFFVVLTLYLFGGELINGLSFTLLIGVVVGTYSSIFIAAKMLQILGFSVNNYRQKLATKEANNREKDRLRSMYEQGTM